MPADVVGEPLIDVIRPLIEHDATASIDERGQAERGSSATSESAETRGRGRRTR
jgi:hypothetical protein